MLATLAPPCSPHCFPFDRGPSRSGLPPLSSSSNRRPIAAPAPAPAPILRFPTSATRRRFQARKHLGSPPSIDSGGKCRVGMGGGIGVGYPWAVTVVSVHSSLFTSVGYAASDHRSRSKVLFFCILPLERSRCVQIVSCKCRKDSGATENYARNLNIEQRDNVSRSCDSIARSNDREFENGAIGRSPEAVATSSSKNQRIPTLTNESGREQLIENVPPRRSFDNFGTVKSAENKSGPFDDSDDNGSFRDSPDEADYIQEIHFTSEQGRSPVMSTDISASNGAVEEQASGLDRRITDDGIRENVESQNAKDTSLGSKISGQSSNSRVETVSIAGKEPIYEVLEVNQSGVAVTKSISRRQLLKSSGLRLRDIRSVDPSLWVTTAMPALLIRDQAILLNLGSLRAIATPQTILLFEHKSIGAQAFLELLQQRLDPETSSGVPTMPFELEVVETALLSRTQRLERKLMEVEPRVLSLLEVLPNCLTANVLEELRLSKQALVELGSRTGALRQMLLELLEDPHEIRRMTVMGRRCIIRKDDGSIECLVSEDKKSADDEEEEIEMLLENYLQRCESCHGQAQRLLDSAKEMEDSIAVNLSSRRLEVSRLELLLQVGTFCSALGALVAGLFGMNLKSYLEECALAFWLTTAGIVLGGVVLFVFMYNYLRRRKIL